MTADSVRCSSCGSEYIVPSSFSDKFEQERLALWLANHDCVGAISLFSETK